MLQKLSPLKHLLIRKFLISSFSICNIIRCEVNELELAEEKQIANTASYG